jgi:non-heme Fe2+,alpha-ketoglutarate-dependent halogenase
MSGTPGFIPSPEALNQLERDLRFHPSTTENPKTLSIEQVEAFNRNGYLSGIRIFDDGEMAEIRRYFDELLAKTLAAGGDSYSISTAHLRYGRVYDILTHPRIVMRIKDLLGENVVAWGSHFFCKMPGDGKRVSWHQDSSYWPLTPSMAVTAWLAIDDATVENACMRYIQGTHHMGHLTYTLSEGGRDLDPQRPAAAWLRGQPIEQTTMRVDLAVLPRNRQSGSGMECKRRDRERER